MHRPQRDGAAREQQIRSEWREGIVKSVALTIAELIMDNVRQLALVLMGKSSEPDSRAGTDGWGGAAEMSLVDRGLIGAAELPAQARSRWRTPRSIAAV